MPHRLSPAALLAALFLLPAPGSAQVRHPLDPLTWQEHWVLLEVLRNSGHYNDSTRLAQARLEEPAKEAVWAWRPGQPVPRAARAVVKQQAAVYEAVVDLANERLLSWTERKGVQPNWLREEFGAMEAEVKKNPEFIAAMKKRGYTDLTFIDCGGGPPGYFGTPEEEGRRLGWVGCSDARRVRNGWPRQIEGLTVIVDLNARKILRVVDEGAVPVPTVNADYDEASIGPLRPPAPPLVVSQPSGPGFRLDGHTVTWHNWSFHVRPDQRVGMIVSTVRYRDGDRERPVLYQGSLSEIFVPYMDPAKNWYARNFLDAGEYVAGGLGKPLERGIDCPDYAVFLDNIVVQDNGRPGTVPRAICLFERVTGDMVWRHRESWGLEGRPKRDLVVRMAAVLGNYDYVLDWVFQPDGAIRVAVGATGINEVKMVAEANAAVAVKTEGNGGANGSGSGAPADAYGRFVDRNIVAVNHDHYFNFRLDLDVDGAANSFRRDQLATVILPKDHPRRSLWTVQGEVLAQESDAQLNVDMHHPSLWRVVNPATTNKNGYPTSYQLVPGMSIETLLTADDYPRRRAGFIDHHLWVTPYQPGERFAAGDYPTLSKPGEGLPQWTSANRPIANTDIVLWYTMGMHHVARAEDWPVMPVAWNGFELRPFDFFDRNPALTLPKQP